MIVYETKLQTNDLTDDILIDMFINWISNTKRNNMELKYPIVVPYECINDKKSISINKDLMLNIIFINKDNEQNISFIAEILFDEKNQIIDMILKIESIEIISNTISIPNIFRNILSSKYMLNDHEIDYYDKPRRMNGKRYIEIQEKIYQLPIIIYHNRNKKAQEKLTREIYGNAHVFYSVINDDNTIEVIYPNKETIFYEEIDFHNISKIIREYNINRIKKEKNHE